MHCFVLASLATLALAQVPFAADPIPTPTASLPLNPRAAATNPYPTSFSPIPWDNAGYSAMTKSQHSAYCQTAKKGTPAYTMACVNEIWGSLYGRTVGVEEGEGVVAVTASVGIAAAVPTTFATLTRSIVEGGVVGGAGGDDDDEEDEEDAEEDEDQEIADRVIGSLSDAGKSALEADVDQDDDVDAADNDSAPAGQDAADESDADATDDVSTA